MSFKKFIKKYSFLIMLTLSTIMLTIVGYAGKNNIYSEYKIEVLSTPQLVAVFEGAVSGKYPWMIGSGANQMGGAVPVSAGGSFRLTNAFGFINKVIHGSGGNKSSEVNNEGDSNIGNNNEGKGNEPDKNQDSEPNKPGDKDTYSKPTKPSTTDKDGKNDVTGKDDVKNDEPKSDHSKNDDPKSGDSTNDDSKNNDASNGVSDNSDDTNNNSNDPNNDNTNNDNTKGNEDKPSADYQKVTESYFEDALFIGDSRTVGLSEYSGWKKPTFYADEGMSVYDVFNRKIAKVNGKNVSILDALKVKQFKKIYIMLGINELGTGTTKTFVVKYNEVITQIRKQQPNALIFVEGIMNVAKKKSDSDAIYNNVNIKKRNIGLSKLANNKTIFYIDVNDAITDQYGNVPEKYTFDSIHLKAAYYKIWTEFLMEHGIVGK